MRVFQPFPEIKVIQRLSWKYPVELLAYLSFWVCCHHKFELRVVQYERINRWVVPRRAVSWVITIVKEKLLTFLNVPDSLSARYQVLPGMLEEPLSAVVDKAVVDFVPQCGAVVVQVDQVPRQVNSLPPFLIGVCKYLVARGVPVLLWAKCRRKPDLF